MMDQQYVCLITQQGKVYIHTSFVWKEVLSFLTFGYIHSQWWNLASHSGKTSVRLVVDFTYLVYLQNSLPQLVSFGKLYSSTNTTLQNRNQARALHKHNFQSVLDEINQSYLERFASRYSACISQVRTEEEARAAFHITSEPQETENHWVIDLWKLITSRTTPAETRDYTTSLSLGKNAFRKYEMVADRLDHPTSMTQGTRSTIRAINVEL